MPFKDKHGFKSTDKQTFATVHRVACNAYGDQLEGESMQALGKIQINMTYTWGDM
jgi:hypothetical protein